MGESKAVFLSYASEDSDAAQRIADGLRAAGIEIWFDKSELRGGDAWDQAIRQRIRDCRLFVPIVSARSDTRLEGYFRREWKLAADRMDDMASSVAFLVPVVIDGTAEASAEVPERFRQVQWTHLPAGALTPAFVARIAQLLAVRGSAADKTRPQAALSAGWQAGEPAQRKRTARWHAMGIALVILIASASLLAVLWRTPQVPSTAKPAAVVSAARPLERSIKSVAVLPFADLSEKHDQEYFADGMAEEIMQRLSRVPELRVSGRASSFFFKGKSSKLSEIAAELGVTHVVEGSVRKSGDHLRIGAELVRTSDGYSVWSDSFDRKLSDVFKIQDEIATAVATALQITLSGGSLTREQGGTRNLEAYQLNLQARHAYNQNSVESLKEDLARAQRAVTLDPDYGNAWVTLAFAWLNLSDHGVGVRSDDCRRVREAATRAISVSPGWATGHAALGYALYECDWNWTAVQLEVQRGLALDSNDGEVMNLAGELALTLGRFDEAERSLRKALERDPLNQFWRFNLGSTLYLAGHYQQAEDEFRHLLRFAPDFGWARPWMAKTLLAEGKPKEAFLALQPVIETDDGLQCLPEVLYANGREAEAASAAKRLEKIYGKSVPYFVAQNYAYVNDRERAFEWLENAYAQKDGWAIWVAGEPLMANLRKDPRYKAFLRKMNLPE